MAQDSWTERSCKIEQLPSAFLDQAIALSAHQAQRREPQPIGIQAIGHSPIRSSKNGIGEQGVIVRFAGISFVPGHFLYADRNGIVVAPHALT
jgi:hypothetical protein